MTASRQLNLPHATKIEYKNRHFLILDQPTATNMNCFIEECQKYTVRELVRCCEPQYDAKLLESVGIGVTDLEFDDGSPPPLDVIDTWCSILRERFREEPDSCVAVHCRAGLGRAPALVAVALIELGMPYDRAIEMIRERRRGALNTKQIQFLKNYRSKRRLRLKNSGSSEASEKCTLL